MNTDIIDIIKEYLTEDEISDIVKNEFHNSVRKIFSTEREVARIISNLSYEFIFECVNNAIDGDFEERIKNGVLKVLNEGIDDYLVFRKSDSTLKHKSSIGQELLDQAVKDNAEIIYQKVKDYLDSINTDEGNWFLADAVKTGIIQKLSS